MTKIAKTNYLNVNFHIKGSKGKFLIEVFYVLSELFISKTKVINSLTGMENRCVVSFTDLGAYTGK